MSNNDLIEHALNHLPDCYEISVSKLEDRIDDKNNPVTIDQLRNELNLRFERMKGKNDDNNKKYNEEEETALLAGGFKGKCHKCGKIGHKARDCREKTNYKKKVRCFYCKKEGHKIENCWKKKNDEKGEQAHQATDNNESDGIILIGLDLPEEEQGPTEKWFTLGDEYDYERFFLGLREYEYCFIPGIENSPQPKFIYEHLGVWERYDKPIDYIEEKEKYMWRVRIWKRIQQSKIMKLSKEELEIWKGKYDKNKKNYFEKKKKNLALNVTTKSFNESDDLFIGDTGASCHMTHSDVGMFDCKEINETVTIGNGNEIKAIKTGKKRVKIIQDNGKEIIGLLENVKYVPKLAPYNLFSITTAIDNGYKLGNEGRKIILSKDGKELIFDREVKTKSGYVPGIKMQPIKSELGREKDNNFGFPTLTIGKKLDINVFHQLLGHVSENVTRNTAKYYGVELDGKFNTCKECALAKAQQKNLGHVDYPKEAKYLEKDYLLTYHQLRNQVLAEQNFGCLP